ncbi:uncharacterized protein VP01_6490g1 [Puccinia sorghi]|uniref:Retrotransposon gag domain-containing protein n=1 Tax=Puccinia sorghi TaxID=27349 RepID=A0A0L6UFN3_9BASI|nr:uncharacterized protein VP01_6490g1 [Puccinia sorghi]
MLQPSFHSNSTCLQTLCQTQARLDAAVGQQNPQNPAPPQQPQQAPAPTASTPISIVLAKPQPFDGTRGVLAKVFVGQIGLHAITYPERFPDDSSKVAFAISFMTDYAATCSQPYLTKIFNREAMVFSEFIDDFKYSFLNHNRHHPAEVALQNLCHRNCVNLHSGFQLARPHC